MQRDPTLPNEPGAYAVVHTDPLKQIKSVAYVGVCKNLRQRASMWEYHLREADANPEYRVPVRDFPRHPADQWVFMHSTANGEGGAEEALRAFLESQGIEILNEKSRVRRTYVIQGIDASLGTHAERLNLQPTLVYSKVKRGFTPEQALGLEPVEYEADKRDRAIRMMPVKILSNGGGYLTYDEAQVERPSVGNIRSKLVKWRKANPTAAEVKLSDIN